MSKIIHSEDDDDDDTGSQSSSSLSSPSISLQQDPIPSKIPLSTSIVLERKLPLEQQQKLSNPTEGSTTDDHISENSPDNKIMIRFVPIGSTPSIQPRVFKISGTQTVSTLNKFLCKKLKFKGVLNLYIQNSFMPLPDESIGSLYGLFKTNNELIISYCNTIAFG
ncbi:autophagy-related protein (12), putative [Candida dubliniensis CD36]|uniref:Ubiquitin-like protein ATG12 n=1 Tax=Candida dubliniensis (strain CD36 / ATCC MYA-646 / CBS 7987 / NCPF 3949 / NRRL Y-17841) TaxID=573826 RepID=B9WA13_CANDC|nr:autophagy-related protein (12), putative [Candida dubliniensis CD36]CAX45650.1 autophagy-related protein (12), putative [Candida dubliniensis CD36]